LREAGTSSSGSAQADSVQVHTKLVPDLDKLATLTHQDIEATIDRSLMRLKIEQLHLVQFYWWDLSVGDPLASFEVLKQLRDAGKIKHLGCTNWDEAAIKPFVENGFDLVSAQIQYSLLDARPAGAFSNWCQQHDIMLLCYGVLAGGFLTNHWLRKPDPGFQFENRSLIKYRLVIEDFGGWDLFQALLDVLVQIGTKHSVGLSTIATRYMLDQPGVAAVIIGARTARHLDQTLSVFDVQLDTVDRETIQAVLGESPGLKGPVYALERDRNGPHGRIMKYNLNAD
jgi:aryl-alcohol dehydrogenase-like predicted oxidoreductase